LVSFLVVFFGQMVNSLVITQLDGQELSIQDRVLCERDGRPTSAAYAVIRQAVRFLRGRETRFNGELLIEFEKNGEKFSVNLNRRSTRDTGKGLPKKALAEALERLIPESLRGPTASR